MPTIIPPEITASSLSRTYILRCWVERGGKGQQFVWRFNLKEVGEDNWHGFSDVASLVSYLKAQFTTDERQDE